MAVTTRSGITIGRNNNKRTRDERTDSDSEVEECSESELEECSESEVEECSESEEEECSESEEEESEESEEEESEESEEEESEGEDYDPDASEYESEEDFEQPQLELQSSVFSQMPPVLIIAPQNGKPKCQQGRTKEASKELMKSFTQEEANFYQHLHNSEQERLKEMHKDIYAKQEGVPPFKFRIMQSMMNLQTKRVALKRLEILNGMDHPEGEYHKLRKWMDKICDVPFGKTIPMPVTKYSSRDDIHAFLEKTKESINAQVYGHQEAKDMIVRIMAQWISNPFSKGNVIGIHGNPGVGKTTLIKDGVCDAIGLPFSFIPLGGSNDASYLDGHSYTYEGSSNGKIIDSLIQAGCDNPVLYFDELDKVSDTARGKEIINVLIHLTDPSQNQHFNDKYFADVNFDLSKCLIVFTYNNPHTIDPILKDRMVTIHTKDYDMNDKVQIASKHLLPSILNQFGLEPKKITIEDDVVRYIVNRIEKEAGVRNLKRALESIVSNINLSTLLENSISDYITIDQSVVDKYVKSCKQGEFPSSHMYM